MNIPYRFDYALSYSTDEEYQHAIQILFQMNSVEENQHDGVLYDGEAVSKTLDAVYAATRDLPLFKEVYDLAAAKMMSEDREIGLAILFSYDYLLDFHALLVAHFTKSSSVESSSIDSLKESLIKKLA
jgi:hypothetical protein